VELSNSFNSTQIKDLSEISSLPRITQLLNWKKSKKENFFGTRLSQAPLPAKARQSPKKSGLFTLDKVVQAVDRAVEKNFFDVQARVIDIKIHDSQLFYPSCGVNRNCQKKASKLKDSKGRI